MAATTVRSSSITEAAATNWPTNRCTTARMLSANGSEESAPASRTSSTKRVASSSKLSSSQMSCAARQANPSQLTASPSADGSAR